uniref:Putative pogo family transposase ixodes scapularis pogo family transposase n=1 Tax=Amblyomma cajennense TaxID=34607 RepID=A0A023FKP0_AMBCJ
MKCSIGWYSRWSRRFGIQLRYEKDDEILEWVLAQLEQNRSVTHNEIQTQAIATLSQTRTGFKCSAGWPIRFCKRHQALLQKMPLLDTPLPAVLEEKISSFRQEVQKLQEQCGVTSAAIGAMDEVPLYFSSGAGGGTGSGSLLVRRCGFEQAQAIVFLSCLSDGGVLPPLALLKGSSSVSEVNGMFVLCQEEMKVDRSTVEYWADRVWGRYVPSPSFLFLDSFEPHKQFAAAASSDIKVAIAPPACSSQTHPVVVWLRRKFQALVNKMSLDRGSSRSIPTVQEMLECIAAAWRHLQATSHDAVQKSFAVTGAVLTGDPNEDDMLLSCDTQQS